MLFLAVEFLCSITCNSLYFGTDKSLLRHLQLVHNAAARFLMGCRSGDHTTPILLSLHWLKVSFRFDFKILILVFNLSNLWFSTPIFVLAATFPWPSKNFEI